ncbi:hypothetical protein EFY87_18120 [Flexivirga caeni]|uniref:Uncharacterized protein n=1 Tax=Flexivirga caeni TaxID=2294115 RepID=A0A3M9M0B3_9MICO|nr:hypothetical protein EFY87_18120 [Flexivirga caeni]
MVRGPWTTFEDFNLVAGWLLWSHRMASPFGDLTGNAFAAVARERGVALSETEISRAEKGEARVTIGAIAKYEQLLQLPPGTLSAPLRSAARLAPRAAGADKLAQLRSVPRAVAPRQLVVNDFYVRYVAGEQFTGGDWLMLADSITYAETSLLPDALAMQWIRQLLDECMRSVNAAYFPRVEALSIVAEHDHYASYLLDAARDLTAAPGASGVIDAWGIVGDIRSRQLIHKLLTDLPSVPDDRLYLYAAAFEMPGYRGDLAPHQLQDIARDLERRLPRWSLGSYEPIASIAAMLPDDLSASILRRIDQDVHPMSRLTGRRMNRTVQAEVDLYTGAAMAASWPGHPGGSVLPELLRLVLSSERFGLRHHAANLIYCSPFAAPICAAAAELCTSGADPVTRQLATYLVSRLATPDNDEELRLLLKRSERIGLTINTLTGMAHAGLLTELDDLKPFIRAKDTRQSGIYAAGITHHPDLYSEAADSAEATWWRRARGGIWE